MAITLTTEEARSLIDMLKQSVEETSIQFPEAKGKVCFMVTGEKSSDEFIINIDRKGINNRGCTYQGRIKSNNIVLLRLDVNPTARHINPSTQEEIIGTHLHVYTEEYDTREAIAFDVNDDDLYGTCFKFFEKFNIIQNPIADYQMRID